MKNRKFMKKHTCKILTLLYLCFSCQTDDNIVIEENIFSNELNQNAIISLSEISNEPHLLNRKTEQLENQMQWTAFLVGETLVSNRLAENEFVNVLSIQNSNTINLRDLLLSINNNSAFKKAFRKQFDIYLIPQNECGRPRGGPVLTGGPGGGSNELKFLNFINYLTVINCIELYLPHGYNASIAENYSSAHPLNAIHSNTAYIHPRDCINDDVQISPFNLLNDSNVIIARPLRSSNCNYEEYSEIDFTDFLSN
ncbi:hypothetical protein D7030_01600 [Flavobacteriaceae bacterium AU392]|nr:hypothetical protein D1817_08055 [Flavobacteriaceae bacterium]RKM86572.1 hypothetical protein D7030_01600 [Flavobacteriaceae bacterium AU392]